MSILKKPQSTLLVLSLTGLSLNACTSMDSDLIRTVATISTIMSEQIQNEPHPIHQPSTSTPNPSKNTGNKPSGSQSSSNQNLAGQSLDIISHTTGKSHTGATFDGVPKDLTFVQTRVRVNQVPPEGLNFFAIQVNFNNGTWAHGGLQHNKGKLWLANWGGLVNRGGGANDYKKANPKTDLVKIQNAEQNTRPYNWQLGRTYELTVWRGDQVYLEAGEYLISGKTIYVDTPRTMWEWHFNIEPVGGGNEFDATIYNSADTINYFMVWNECGYGSCGQTQHATWFMPSYSNAKLGDYSDNPTRFRPF